jgi:hypothetical protein
MMHHRICDRDHLVKVYIARPQPLTDQRRTFWLFSVEWGQQHPLRLAGTSGASPEPRRTLAGHSP